MLLFVGLGNPGSKYATSRHNMGFLWIDQFVKYLSHNSYYVVSDPSYNDKDMYCIREIRTNLASGGKKIGLILKPLTFMNLSGTAVKKIIDMYKINPEDIFVAHDDLDIPLGKFKISFATYPKTHNGIKSLHTALGFANMWYIRLGIDNRNENPQYKFIPPADYVLLPYSSEELDIARQEIVNSIEQLWSLLKDRL